MLGFITHTWNPVIGCLHNCIYCMGRGMAKRFAEGSQYADKYSKLYNAKSNSFVLVCDKADLFGNWTPDEWIINVINDIKETDQRITFLFLTKNPARFHDFINLFPENCLLGATIETNRDGEYEKYSKAPKPSERYRAMKSLDFPRKFISIEPMMDFDTEIFQKWIRDIAPEKVIVGAEPLSIDAHKREEGVEEKKEIYCWNCKKDVKVIEAKIVPEIGDIASEPPIVAYCPTCYAILEPKMTTCYLCKIFVKTFYTGLMMHGGEMYHALCWECREIAKEVKASRFNL